LLEIHSHRGQVRWFSGRDAAADLALLPAVHGWGGDGLPHASAVMLPDGEIFGRTVGPDGEVEPLSRVSVAGDEIRYWHPCRDDGDTPQHAPPHAPALGRGPTPRPRPLSAAAAGCSSSV